ncbi:MAG: hypothetical protein AAGK00_05705 [Pseudomonadota bacterium]
MSRFVPGRYALLVVAALLQGCSPAVFKKQTAEFAGAAGTVEQTWIALHDEYDALKQAERDRDRIRQEWVFDVSPACGQFAGMLAPALGADLSAEDRKAAIERREAVVKACALVRLQADQPAPGVIVEPVDRRLLPYAKAITAYADGLALLTAAADEASFRGAAAELGASLGKAGSSLAQLGDADIDVSGPISALASVYAEITLATFEHRKYTALRDVVRDSEGAIDRLTTRLAGLETRLRQRLLQAQFKALRAAAADLESLPNGAPRAERLKRQQAVMDRLAEYQAYAKTLTQGGASYRAVGAAHAALLEAVNNPDSFELAKAAAERIKAVGDAAKDAADALKLDLPF